MAGRFPLYTDTDVDGPVVKALRGAAWDVVRGIDAYPERTRDYIHFARAAQERRVLVSNDIASIVSHWKPLRSNSSVARAFQ